MNDFWTVSPPHVRNSVLEFWGFGNVAVECLIKLKLKMTFYEGHGNVVSTTQTIFTHALAI